MTGRRPIDAIVVLGAGLTGLCAALAFRKALPRATITLVATPTDGTALADRLPGTLPGSDALATLGVDEDALVRGGGATHRLAQQFDGWRDDGATFLHGYGPTGEAIGGLAFHQAWRGVAAEPFDRYSPAARLAAADRFIHPVADPSSPLSRFDYALRLDPERAPRIFADLAAQRDIARIEASLASIARTQDGHVEKIMLLDGTALGADLFVDCSGVAGPLLADPRRHDWSEAVATDRLLVAAVPAAPSPLDRYVAERCGWSAQWPLRDRALLGFAYAADCCTEDRARRSFSQHGRGAQLIAFEPGASVSPWQHNVLALGDAAAVTGPLGWTGLALALSHLTLALELLPGADCHPLILAEFNRRAALRAERMRDFVALPMHFRADPAALPASLAHTLARFGRRAMMPAYEEETLARDDWLAMLFGLGVRVAAPDPAVMGQDPATIQRQLALIAENIAALPTRLPPYPEYLAMIARA